MANSLRQRHSKPSPRFWPWALLHFCRTFNYWPSKDAPPPWERMKDSRMVFDIERDIHTWGSYMTAKLGCDTLTPTVWMYSFRLQRVI
mmetsp:Transcript_45822/g.93778  ORF Transcript_45822/g.93778 Transcript_45822/m.93778 type:complete len:88 (+) Transcript_45822:435-698(+)